VAPKARGKHTWELTYHYHRCPDCGYVFENRDDYDYRVGIGYCKDLECPRCHQHFSLKKAGRLIIGPLFGNGEHIETEWGDG